MPQLNGDVPSLSSLDSSKPRLRFPVVLIERIGSGL